MGKYMSDKGAVQPHVPTVGIGMPVYNGAKYIRLALESLMKQTFVDFQLTICDDGSTDGSLEICREFAKDPRIQVVMNEHRLGGAKNFNRVFDLSRGEYFMWAAQDDLFHSTFIEKCLARLQASPKAVMALYEVALIDEEGKRINAASSVDTTNIGTEGMDVVRRLHEVFRRTGWWALYGIIRPEVLRKTRLFRSEFAGDVILIAELLLHGEFAKVEEPLFYYRYRLQQPFTVRHNLQSIDHTLQPGRTPYTGFLRSLVRLVSEFDLEPLIKKKIIVDMIKTFSQENYPLGNNLLQENKDDLIAMVLTCDDLHRSALRDLDAKCKMRP